MESCNVNVIQFNIEALNSDSRYHIFYAAIPAISTS